MQIIKQQTQSLLVDFLLLWLTSFIFSIKIYHLYEITDNFWLQSRFLLMGRKGDPSQQWRTSTKILFHKRLENSKRKINCWKKFTGLIFKTAEHLQVPFKSQGAKTIDQHCKSGWISGRTNNKPGLPKRSQKLVMWNKSSHFSLVAKENNTA